MPLFRTLSTSRATLVALTKVLSLIHLFVPLPNAYGSASQKAHITTAAFKNVLLPALALKRPLAHTMLLARPSIAASTRRHFATSASTHLFNNPSSPMPSRPFHMADQHKGASDNAHWRFPVGLGVGAALAGTLAMLTASYAHDEVGQHFLQATLNQDGPLEHKAMAVLRQLQQGKQRSQHDGETTYLLKLRTSEHCGASGQTSGRTYVNEENLKAVLALIQQALSKGVAQGERTEFFKTVAFEPGVKGTKEEWVHIVLRTNTSEGIPNDHAFSWEKLKQHIKGELASLQKELSTGWALTDVILTPPMQYYFDEGKQSTQSHGSEDSEATTNDDVVIKHSMQCFQEAYKSTIFFHQLKRCEQNIVYGLQSRPAYPFPYVRIEVAGELQDLQRFKACMALL